MELWVEYNMRDNKKTYKTLLLISIFILLILILFCVGLTKMEDIEINKKLVDKESVKLGIELPDEPLSLPPSYKEGTNPKILP